MSESEYTVRPMDVLVPFGDRIVILPDPPEEMIGSFYVPDTAQQRPARGTIVAVGPDVSPAVRVGQRVLYGHFTGSDALHGRAEVKILREADLFAAIYPSDDAPPADQRDSAASLFREAMGDAGLLDVLGRIDTPPNGAGGQVFPVRTD